MPEAEGDAAVPSGVEWLTDDDVAQLLHKVRVDQTELRRAAHRLDVQLPVVEQGPAGWIPACSTTPRSQPCGANER